MLIQQIYFYSYTGNEEHTLIYGEIKTPARNVAETYFMQTRTFKFVKSDTNSFPYRSVTTYGESSIQEYLRIVHKCCKLGHNSRSEKMTYGEI